mgnify:CR=1 FL=1
MTTDPNSWLMSGGVPAAKFEAHGDTIKGTITEAPELRQQTDFDTGAPKFWDDGKPMMQLVITLATDDRDPATPDDDGTRRLYVKGKLQQAIAAAIRKAEANGLAVGGVLTVAYVGDDEPKKRGARNEPLDTWGYAYAATHHPELRLHRLTRADWERRAEKLRADRGVREADPARGAPPAVPVASVTGGKVSLEAMKRFKRS